jgi:superfamily II DNA or RNA helicase
MKTKNEIQLEALQAVLDSFNIKKKNAIVEAATGVGKTKIAYDLIKVIVSHVPTAKILIVVPTELLRDEEWKSEATKWDCEYVWENNIERVCYASLNKIENTEYNLVILDEIQNITDNNAEFFFINNNKIKKILGLTATLPKEFEKAKILKSLALEVCYKIPIDEAVKNKLVSPYEIVLVKTKLDNLQPTVKFGTKLNPFYLTEEKAYIKLSKDIEFAKVTNNFKKIDMLIFSRMRVLYNSINKTSVANFIINNLIGKDERTLIFCGSIKQAEMLCPYTYHSKSSTVSLQKFKSGEINTLSCVNALNEGHNIPNVDNAVITQVTSKERHLIQRVGRIIRYKENHVGKIYLIVVENTVDEQWMQKALENIDNLKIKTIDANELIPVI